MGPHLNENKLLRGEKQAQPCKQVCEPRNVLIFRRHKPPCDRLESLKCVALMPAAKAAQLYGLEDVSPRAKRLVERTERFKKEHPVLGRISEIVSWAAIGFAMSQAGAFLAEKMRPIGSTLSDIIGYTVACAHPSAVALSLKRIFKVKSTGAGVSRYLEASVVGYVPSSPAFYATLGLMAHRSATVGIGAGIAAAVTASLVTYTTWAAAFTAYWVRVVRHEKGEGFWQNVKDFVRGFVSARKFGKAEHEEEKPYLQAGEIVGTGFMVWAIPWYMLRAGVAAFIGAQGLAPAMFTKLLISVMAGLEGVDTFLSGLETTIVEKVLRRARMKEEPREPESPKSRDDEDEKLAA